METDMDVTEQSKKIIEHEELYGDSAIYVDMDYIASNEYRMKFHGITGNSVVDDKIAEHSRRILTARSGTHKETLVIIDKDTGNELLTIDDSERNEGIDYKPEHIKKIKDLKLAGKELIAIHNHATGYPPNVDDCVSARIRGYNIGVVCGHNGTVTTYEQSDFEYTIDECNDIHNAIVMQCKYETNIKGMIKLWADVMEHSGCRIHERR